MVTVFLFSLLLRLVNSSIEFYEEDFFKCKTNKEKTYLKFKTPLMYGHNGRFTLEELNCALTQIKRNSSAGKDNVILFCNI